MKIRETLSFHFTTRLEVTKAPATHEQDILSERESKLVECLSKKEIFYEGKTWFERIILWALYYYWRVSMTFLDTFRVKTHLSKWMQLWDEVSNCLHGLDLLCSTVIFDLLIVRGEQPSWWYICTRLKNVLLFTSISNFFRMDKFRFESIVYSFELNINFWW